MTVLSRQAKAGLPGKRVETVTGGRGPLSARPLPHAARMSTRLAGHGLRSEGMAFTMTGNAMPGFPSGPGCAKCECGALSEHLPNRARRKAWHRAHKNEICHGQPNLILLKRDKILLRGDKA